MIQGILNVTNLLVLCLEQDAFIGDLGLLIHRGQDLGVNCYKEAEHGD